MLKNQTLCYVPILPTTLGWPLTGYYAQNLNSN